MIDKAYCVELLRIGTAGRRFQSGAEHRLTLGFWGMVE